MSTWTKKGKIEFERGIFEFLHHENFLFPEKFLSNPSQRPRTNLLTSFLLRPKTTTVAYTP